MRMDVLLARQYNLISCMAEQGGLNDSGRRGNSLEEKTLGEAGYCGHAACFSSGSSSDGIVSAVSMYVMCRRQLIRFWLLVLRWCCLWLNLCWVVWCLHCCCPDRIEAMRREIGVASVSSGVDQVQLEELLGEGTYGKVYKGKRTCAAVLQLQALICLHSAKGLAVTSACVMTVGRV
jgi:hypothetical protein